MARMPGADWRPIGGNKTPSGMGQIFGVALHIMAGTLTGTESWFNNPRAEASSHFGTGRAGALRQWVDTRDRAWAQAAGNPHWISIENEGKGGDELTDAQLDACARVLAWAHTEHGVPLRIASSPSERGLGHHAMGGAAWGNHTACPGTKVIAQKAEIVRRAKALLAPPKPIKVVIKNGVPQRPGRTLKGAGPHAEGRRPLRAGPGRRGVAGQAQGPRLDHHRGRRVRAEDGRRRQGLPARDRPSRDRCGGPADVGDGVVLAAGPTDAAAVMRARRRRRGELTTSHRWWWA